MKRIVLAPFIVSVVGIGLFMNHFWQQAFFSGAILWTITSVCAIYAVYAGIIHRSLVEDKQEKAILLAAAVIGGIILLGITLSAIFLFVPRMT